MNGTQPVRPSSQYYLVALAFFVAGIALTIIFFVVDTHRIRNSMVSMDVPGTMDLDLQRLTPYTIFAEAGKRLPPERPLPNPTPEAVRCEVHMLPAGESVPPKQSSYSASYTYGNRKGVAVLDFEVPHNGSYTIDCQGPAELDGQKVQALVGGGTGKAFTAIMGKSFLLLAGGIVIGTLIFIRIAMLRLESRREIREQGLRPV
jgi:hypothetical protein